MRFARETFELAGDAVLAALRAAGDNSWAWREAHGNPRAYLAKIEEERSTAPRRTVEETSIEMVDIGLHEDDPAVSASRPPLTLLWTFHVLWSPAFQVPVLYFRAQYADGSPVLPTVIVELVDPLLRAYQSGPFPALSQDDHPFLAVPFMLLHPCGAEALLDSVNIALTPAQALLSWLSLQAAYLPLRIPTTASIHLTAT